MLNSLRTANRFYRKRPARRPPGLPDGGAQAIAGGARPQYRRSLCPSGERTDGRHNSWDLKGSESADRGIVGTDTDRRRALGSLTRRPVGAGGQHGGPPHDHSLGYPNRRASGDLLASNRELVPGQFLERRALGALHVRGGRPPTAHVGRAFSRTAECSGHGMGRLGRIIRAGLPPAAASTSRKCMTGSSAFSRAAWIPPPSGPWVR